MSAARTGAGQARSLLALLGIAVMAGLFFAYVAWRASRLAITWDEAANYLEFTRKGLLSPFWFPFPHFGANNHFLNSWLTFLTTQLGGPSELSLRLPVLVAHLLFLYYTARLAWTLRSPVQRVCAFAVLNLNPYLLDFFSLARGYGLSYGLLAGSLWYLHEYLRKDFDPRQGRFALGFAMLAVTAHLTLVHFVVALVAVVVLAPIVGGSLESPVLQRLRAAVQANAVALAGVGLFLAPTLLVIRRLARAGAFFYGGRTGFWHDTVLSVMERSLYEQRYGDLPQLFGVIALLVVGGAVVVAVRHWSRRGSPADLYLPVLLALLCTCALASIAQHHLLDVRYLTGRTALYLLVLWTFVLVVLFRELSPLYPRWRYCLPGAAVVLALHAARCANGRYVLEWKAGADVKEIVRDLATNQASRPPGKPTLDLGASLDYEAPLNYYRAAAGLTWLNLVDRRARTHPLNDLYLYSPEDWRATDPDSFTVLRMYRLSSARLLQRRVRPARYVVLRSITAPAAPARAADAGARLTLPVEVSSSPAARSIVTVVGLVRVERPVDARAELAIRFRRGDSSYSWHGAAVQDFAPRPRTWYPVSLSCFVPPEARDGDAVTLSLDHELGPVQLRRLTLRWLTAED